MKKLYLITIILIFSCVIANIYRFLVPNSSSIAYSILNLVTPIIALVYLALVIKKKKESLKKINEKIHKIFGKS